MARAILLVACVGLTSCSPGAPGDRQLLAKCWNAVPTGASGEYRLSFDAIILPGTEGGIYARSRNCPDHRLGLDYGSELVRVRFENAAEKVVSGRLGVGVHAKASARIKKRKTDYFMTVKVTELQSFDVMTDAETDAFIRDFRIG